jgi:hypothetical protein
MQQIMLPSNMPSVPLAFKEKRREGDEGNRLCTNMGLDSGRK